MVFARFNFKWTLILSLIIFILGVVVFFGMPWFLKRKIRGQMHLAPDSAIRPMYTQSPMPLDYKLYLWNVTNKEEVVTGGKPKLQQVGPYYFEEWKEKFDMVDDEAKDQLTYHYRNTFVFRPDLSGPGLTGDETITMLHPFIAGTFLALNIGKKEMLEPMAGAIGAMFDNPSDPFFTGRAMDIAFDGIPVNCGTEHPVAKGVCESFAAQPAMRKIDDQHYAFSLFGGTNHSDLGQFTVFRGKKVSPDIGRVVSFNGATEMKVYDDDECNQYVGTDGTIFPPFMKKKAGVWAYEPSMCRALGATYKGKAKYNGLPVLRFELEMSDPINVNKCYCRPNGDCPLKGTVDLLRCSGSPLVASHPHFYLGDPQLLANVASGMNPNKDEHGVFMLFEIMTGTPFSAGKRLQFNLDVVPIPEVEMMKGMRKMVFPTFWIEEGANLPPAFTDPLKKMFLMVKIQKIVQWACMAIGLLGSILSGYMMYANQDANKVRVKGIGAKGPQS